MFVVDNGSKKIEMNKGDFGVILAFCFNAIEGTNVKFKIYEKNDPEKVAVIEKNFDLTDTIDNKVEIELTEEETSKLEKKEYCWGLYQYIEGDLKNSLLVDRKFIVKEGV